MNVNNMTAQQAADWCADDDGWRESLRHVRASGEEVWCWERDGGDDSFSHPHPLTLDGAAAALPEGWSVDLLFTYTDGNWGAKAFGPAGMWAINGPDELTARYRLAVACRMAAKEQA
jgi:hypothetical protein